MTCCNWKASTSMGDYFVKEVHLSIWHSQHLSGHVVNDHSGIWFASLYYLVDQTKGETVVYWQKRIWLMMITRQPAIISEWMWHLQIDITHVSKNNAIDHISKWYNRLRKQQYLHYSGPYKAAPKIERDILMWREIRIIGSYHRSRRTDRLECRWLLITCVQLTFDERYKMPP